MPFQSSYRFAGHSKWANIRHDKAKNDAKRSKEAAFISSRIESSVRHGGKEGNANLESLIDKAKKLNVPKQVIQSAIKRGTGEIAAGTEQSEVTYEFMGPGGVALMVSALTDNKARTVMRVKNALAYFDASMSSCNYMFTKKGEIVFEPLQKEEDFDQVFETAIEIGAEDIEEVELDESNASARGKLFRLICADSDLHSICNQLSNKGYKLVESSVRFVAEAENQVEFPEANSKGFLRALDNLDQTPEVTDYFTNIENEHQTRILASL
ncbi:uncharacterized protein LODBEIA_P43550 [Lodderomyces beijingensis]|uniref:Transcriptional regulatory protein n=1 Tax=Lodderomyces beijingensis TaxID=1775926 RepID=A0ABP0ZSP5_9ASCO